MNPVYIAGMFPCPGAAYQPKVAVVDEFDQKAVDIDGDNVPDLSHGETVVRYILAQCPTANVTRIEVTSQTKNNPLALNDLLKKSLDAVNISLSLPRELVEGMEDAACRQQLIEKMGASVGQIIAKLQTLAKSGVRVYIANGNGGEKEMNAMALADGVINVGATSAHGVATDFSHQNPLVTDSSQGVFAVTKVKGGYDLTGDQQADVFDHEVSGGTPFVAAFSGKPLRALLATPEELEGVRLQVEAHTKPEKIPLLHQRLFRMKDLKDIGLMTQVQYDFHRTLGEYAVMNPRPYMGKGSWQTFGVENGRACYQPDGSARKNAVNKILGASISTPFKLGNDMQLLAESRTAESGVA